MTLSELRRKFDALNEIAKNKATAQTLAPTESTRKPISDPYWQSRLGIGKELPGESAFTRSLRHLYGQNLPRVPSTAQADTPAVFSPLAKGCADCRGEEPWFGTCKFCHSLALRTRTFVASDDGVVVQEDTP
jgi:hypothetical protein